MRTGIIVMMLALSASVFSITSCTKENAGGYLCADYDLFISNFDLEVYDYTVTYTDVKTGAEVTKAITVDDWKYKEVKKVSKRPSPFVLKIEAKLKPDAEDLINVMAERGDYRDHGYSYRCTAGIYEEESCTKLKTGILSSKNDFKISLKGDALKQVLNQPTIHVLDITK